MIKRVIQIFFCSAFCFLIIPEMLQAGDPTDVWVVKTGAEIRGDATIAGEHLLIACDNKVMCLDRATGRKIWEKLARNPNTPAYGNGYAYISTESGMVCFSVATGEKRWSKSVRQGTDCAPTYGNGKVVVGSEDGLYCLDASSGSIEWKFSCQPTFGAPCISDGKAYVTARKSQLHCVSLSTGAEVWSRKIGQVIKMGAASSPVVLGDLVYVGSGDPPLGVYAFDKSNGMMIFKTETPGIITKTCVAAKSGKVAAAYFTKPGITVIDSEDGSVSWQKSTGKAIFTKPCITGSYVYIFPTDGSVLKFSLNSGTLLSRWRHSRYGHSGMGFSGSTAQNDMVYLVSRDEGIVVGLTGL